MLSVLESFHEITSQAILKLREFESMESKLNDSQKAEYQLEIDALVGAVQREADLLPDKRASYPDELSKAQQRKVIQMTEAYHNACNAGVLTTPGLTVKFGQQDCVMVDGVIRYAELKSLPVIPKLIEADGTEHIATVSLADGQVIRLEQFEAAMMADEKLRTLLAAIAAASTLEQLEAISW